MKKPIKMDEFAHMAKESGSITPALGLLAQIYKNNMPAEASLESSAMSCYLSGATCALALMSRLGYLTRKGDAIAENFVTDLLKAQEP